MFKRDHNGSVLFALYDPIIGCLVIGYTDTCVTLLVLTVAPFFASFINEYEFLFFLICTGVDNKIGCSVLFLCG